ncbi:MAG: D-2-hydroxyacid dehydrogenase [Erysipelotrichaceae bacterium]|nr:D-2-hydroxyacid dehydrogenase [Erysipelotrichaceae bacterium]
MVKGEEAMSVKVIISGNHTEKTIERFKKLNADVVFVPSLADADPKDLAEAEIVAGGVNPQLLEKMPKLRFVQLFSAGANSYGWLPEQITLANAYGAYGESIAEHMLTTTLMAMKRMPEYLDMQKEQGWNLLRDIDRFAGSNILSVGMGAIGTAYLKKADALGAVCYGVRRSVHDKPEFVQKLVTVDEMDELLPEMDAVALSLPGTAEVKGMFDERRLRLMKKSAILLNTGRGNSVVTDDLIKVMNEGHLKAACLDVMDPEPLPKDHPLWTTPRVYITPHISGGYRAGVNYESVTDVVYRNIELVLSGEPPVHTVDRKLGY